MAVLGPQPEVRRSLFRVLSANKGEDILQDVERAITNNNEWLPSTFEAQLGLELEMMVIAILNEGEEAARERYQRGLTRLSA